MSQSCGSFGKIVLESEQGDHERCKQVKTRRDIIVPYQNAETLQERFSEKDNSAAGANSGHYDDEDEFDRKKDNGQQDSQQIFI